LQVTNSLQLVERQTLAQIQQALAVLIQTAVIWQKQIVLHLAVNITVTVHSVTRIHLHVHQSHAKAILMAMVMWTSKICSM
jgi:hypothetical protein